MCTIDKSPTTGVEVSLQKCITCYLCGELYRRPRILPCGHTFCSECLSRLKDEILQDSEYQMEESWTRSTASSNSTNGYPREGQGDTNGLVDGNSITITKEETSQAHNGLNSSRLHKSPSASNRPKSYEQNVPHGISRSSTFSASQRSMSGDRSPSRFSAPPDVRCNSCAHCGNATTIPRRAKSAQRASVHKSHQDEGRLSSRPRWDNKIQHSSNSNFSSPACSFELKHGREMEQFFCPMPECGYSLRLMNLARWSPRNKAVADVVTVWGKLQEGRKEVAVQTDIGTSQSLIVTIPRSLVPEPSLRPLSDRRRHSSMMDMAIDHAVSMDSLERGYIPQGHFTWRSYAAMVGMNILHQIVNL